VAAAAWTWWTWIDRFFAVGVFWHGRDVEQLAGEIEAGLAGGAGKQAIMPDAMEAAREDMEQEAADKLVGWECHDALAVGPVAAIILVAKSNAGTVKGQETPVRYGM